jgi:hypothetical protein
LLAEGVPVLFVRTCIKLILDERSLDHDVLVSWQFRLAADAAVRIADLVPQRSKQSL